MKKTRKPTTALLQYWLWDLVPELRIALLSAANMRQGAGTGKTRFWDAIDERIVPNVEQAVRLCPTIRKIVEEAETRSIDTWPLTDLAVRLCNWRDAYVDRLGWPAVRP